MPEGGSSLFANRFSLLVVSTRWVWLLALSL
jgi:hypothetical protein